MCADHPPPGAAGLLRVAGLPVAALTDVGNPALFAAIRAHAHSEAEYRVFGAALTGRLSRDLIPHLPGALRGPAVDVRRKLLRGAPVDAEQCRALAAVSTDPAADDVSGDLLRVAAWSHDLRAEEVALAEATRAEQTRLAGLPWQIVTGSTAATRIVAETAPDLLGEIRDRLAVGEDWTGKRMRQRADYLLRLLARAAFKTTPRGWLGQVAQVECTDGPGGLAADLRVGDYAVHRVANIHADRRALTTADELPDAWLSMTGLYWVRDGRLCCWVPDGTSAGGLRMVGVRATVAVDAVREVLGAGVVRTADVIALLAPGTDERRTDVVRAFVRHLVGLGVVQVSACPAATLSDWSPAPAANAAHQGFVDVYRHGGGGVPATAVDRLAETVPLVGRLGAVLRDGQESTHPALDLLDEQPRTVADLVAEFLDGREPQPVRRPSTAWPTPRQDTPYQRLCDWLDTHADDDRLDITADLLDRIGAPEAQPVSWPLDCLVRPLPTGPHLAVLEAVLPAGVIDARFTDALRRLHGPLPQVDAYGAFLDDTAARCGVDLVEILVPPHGDRSANAVRRPHYTRTWTGDADVSTYLAEHARPGRYLPLDRITVRRVAGRVIATDPSGAELWPVCHATRVPPAPWDVVVAVLTAAAPVGTLARPFVLGDPMTALPGRDRVGRIVLDGDLVLAGRSARLSRAALPTPGVPVERRVRQLADLRSATGLPRWNFVRAEGTGRPRPVDLDSVAALRVFDRLLADTTVSTLVVEEMLPDPEHLPVRDESGDRLAAQLLVRLPHRGAPSDTAAEVAASWQAANPRPEVVTAAL